MTRNITKMAPQASETRYGGFKPVVGDTGAILYVLEPSNGASYLKSMKLLDDANLRPLTRQAILLLLMKDEKLKNFLKGKWFWLAGQDMEEGGIFTIDKKGELREREIGKEEKLSVEQEVCVRPGEQPLSFYVLSDDYAAGYGWRFVLLAGSVLRDVAPMVVGMPTDREAIAHKNNTQPNVPAHLLRKAKKQVVELRKHQKPETIDAIEEVLDSL
jgi:hypothetical protein